MKKLFVAIGSLLLVQCVFAQNLLSSFSMSGSVTALTTSGKDVYTLGGGGRTGRYYYWRPVTLETTGANVPLSYNASTGLVSSASTYYSPATSASGSAATSFSNSAVSALWSVSGSSKTTPLPSLAAHQWVRATATSDPRFYFSVPNDTDVTITITGSASLAHNIYALSGEVIGSESGKPNTFTVTGGGSYCFWAQLTNAAALGKTNSLSFSVKLVFSPVGG